MWIEKSPPLLLDLIQYPGPDCLERIQGRLADMDAGKIVYALEILDDVPVVGGVTDLRYPKQCDQFIFCEEHGHAPLGESRWLSINGPTIIHPVVFLSVLHAYHYPISAIGTSISSGRLCENISAYTGTKQVNTSKKQRYRWTPHCSAAQGWRPDVTKDAE